ncbi:MAG TPA: AbrB/MazE/SpoVT family DNA-binding domain-containing protein [Acidimicrobiales bacterium]|nr:AbrB/MazE/SpoVT family DNA-binding domain-containing protein [Acidimicrobiales bacterium]
MINNGGLPRRIDHLGRIVVPVELRRMLGIKAGDELEIAVRDGTITLTKAGHACAFCSSQENLHSYRERWVCSDCASAVGELTDDDRLAASG